MEHASHARHVVGVETAQVETRQAGAIREHISHVFHIVGHEAAQVEARQARAVVEQE